MPNIDEALPQCLSRIYLCIHTLRRPATYENVDNSQA